MGDPRLPTTASIAETRPGLKTRLHWSAVRLALALSKILKGKGFGRAVDALGQAFGCDDYVVVEVEGGRYFRVGMHDGYWLAPLLRDGVYEPEVGYLIELLISPKSLFIDCGANLGYWAVQAGRWIEDPIRIVAIEPSPYVFELLVANSRINAPGFRCLQAAAWSQSEQALAFSSHATRHAWGSGDEEVRKTLEGSGFSEVHVQTVTIDKVFREVEREFQEVLIKLDVEGSEIKALEGARQTIQKSCVIYEEHGREARSDVTAWFLNEGNAVFYCSSEGRIVQIDTVTEADAIRSDRSRGYNFVSASPGGAGFTKLQARAK